MSYINVDFTEYRAFFGLLKKASDGEVQQQLNLFLEQLGFEFLNIIQDEIIELGVIDSSKLLASFTKGDEQNIWNLDEGTMSLEIGTNTEYAEYVNDGHYTNRQGVERRFVPGYFEGDKFLYDKNSKKGIVLKRKWIDGTFYYESALNAMQKIMPELLEKKMDQWLRTYFNL